MEICERCKGKLVDFYHFKMTTYEHIKTIVPNHRSEQQNAIQIVKDFMIKHPTADIEVDLVADQLVIKTKSMKNEEISQIKEESSCGVETEEELETEYLEDHLIEDLLPNEEILETTDVLEDHLIEEVDNENDSSMIEYYDSESCESQQQSTNEEVSDSKPNPNPRRPRRPETWISTKRKTLRNSGQSYLNSSGKVVEARKMKESCGTTCRSKCMTKITEDDRLHNFKTFWDLGDVVKQRRFIYMHIVSSEPKRRRAQNTNRTLTHNFFLDAKDEQGNYQAVQVCKKLFKNTLVVSTQVIQGVVRKYAIEGFVDTRGKFERKLTEGQILAQEQVKQFPFFYIEQSMTKVQCYQMYLDECAKKGVQPVRESNYRVIFDKQNQSSFLKTEKVSCKDCHRFYRATDEERLKLQAEHDIHVGRSGNKKCRDRALGRIRHQRALERRRAERMKKRDQKE